MTSTCDLENGIKSCSSNLTQCWQNFHFEYEQNAKYNQLGDSKLLQFLQQDASKVLTATLAKIE